MSSGTVTSSYVGDLGVANVAASYNYDTQENKHVVSSNANCFQVYSYICIYIVPKGAGVKGNGKRGRGRMRPEA